MTQALFDAAVRSYQMGDFGQTEHLCLQRLRAAPNDFAAHHLLGLARFLQTRFEEALASFDQALSIKPDYAEAWNNRGSALQELKRFEQALASYDRALAVKPDDIRALNNRGNALRDLGRLPEALASLERALALKPDYAGALNNYGLALRDLKRFDEALGYFNRAFAARHDYAAAHYNRAITLRDLQHPADALADFDRLLVLEPNNAATLFQRGNALRDLQRPSEALSSYDRALAIEPNHAEALSSRGILLCDLNRYADALTSFDAALCLDADNAAILNNRGTALYNLKRFAEALASYQKSLAIAPDLAETLNNQGTALRGLKRLDEALASHDQALAIAPDFAAALYNRALVLSDQKRVVDALASYDRALAIKPDFAEALNDRSTALRALRQLGAALASCDRALAVKPDYAEAWYNRGGILRDLKRFDEALFSYDKALSLRPDFPEALSSRASLLWTGYGRLEDAIRDLEKLIVLDPDYDYALGEMLHLRMYGADWQDFDRQTNLLDAGVRSGKRVATPFIYQVTSQSPADLRACAALYTQDRYPPRPALWTSTKRAHDKIRLGYVSGEFRAQATAYLMAGLYEAHDKSQFELVAFDNGRNDNSPMRARLEAAFDKLIDITGLPDSEAAVRIAAEEIDILVNLNGYFGEGRMGVFALKPAPIQVNFLGFPGTLGAPYIDYILADRIVIPEAEQDFYTEKIVYLPDSYQVNDRSRPIADSISSRAEHGLPENAFVFCNFNQGYKLTPVMFAAWTRILKQADGSVLWLLDSSGAFSENLRRAAERQGVSGERLIFAPHIPMEQHLARLRLADLFLDSVPCNAHTTASDALWAGLPLLACRGKAFAGRVAASLLSAIGLPELVTENLEDYEALALRLVGDPALHKSIRQKLAQNRLTTPLFDTDRFRRHLEDAYRTMWKSHNG